MVQAAAINELMTKAMDNPKLAAELLREHNCYDAQVMGRRLLRKWGYGCRSMTYNITDRGQK